MAAAVGVVAGGCSEIVTGDAALNAHRRAGIVDHRMRDEMLAHDHLAGAVAPKVRGLLFGMRARDDRKTGIDRTRLLDDLPAFETIRHRDQKAARGRVVRGLG